MTPVQIENTAPAADRKSANSFREQVMLTVKVLLLTGGTLGSLALLEWIAVK